MKCSFLPGDDLHNAKFFRRLQQPDGDATDDQAWIPDDVVRQYCAGMAATWPDNTASTTTSKHPRRCVILGLHARNIMKRPTKSREWPKLRQQLNACADIRKRVYAAWQQSAGKG